MATTPPCWSDRAAAAIRTLANYPWSFFLALLALNAVARPYSGITHDARLYSAQVLNAIDPKIYGGDLFFQFGSQDQFSLFSRFAAPLVSILGLEPAFFLIYVAFNTLLIFAFKRLVEALIEDRLISSLALIFLVAAPLNFGGLKTLHVHEPFVTSRLLANAFVLLGLERLLRERTLAALALILLAMAFHPLMAVGGLFIWCGCTAWKLLPGKVLAALTVATLVTVTAVLVTPSIATRMFGTMDESWRAIVLNASPFNFTSEWTGEDWLNIAMGLLAVGAGAWALRESRVLESRFLTMVVVVGIAGVIGTVLHENLPYALLLQGQPYRALWILKVLQVPFTFWLAAQLWRLPHTAGPLAAACLVGILGLTSDLALEWYFPLFFMPVLVLRCRGLEFMPRCADWWRRSLASSIACGAVAWAIYKLGILLTHAAFITQHRLDGAEYLLLLIATIGPIPWLLFFAGVAVWAAPTTRFGPAFRGCALTLVLLVQGGMAMTLASAYYRESYTRHGADIAFVQDFLKQQRAPANPTIYSSLGRLDLVWLDLQAKSYFDWWQMGGVMFHRQTAIEGQRRARVVGPFEVTRFRETGAIPGQLRMQASRFFAVDFESAHPDRKDLEVLCHEDGIDYLLLTQEFPGLVTAGNGSVYLYDCRKVRASLNVQAPTAAFRESAPQFASATPAAPLPLSPSCKDPSP